jgi:hypothetical protein
VWEARPSPEWAPGGPRHHRLSYALARLREAGVWPTQILWHQGEADALYATSAAEYVQSFKAMAESLRNMDVAVPLYLATASFFALPDGYTATQSVLRHAQQALIDPDKSILAGPTPTSSRIGLMVALSAKPAS